MLLLAAGFAPAYGEGKLSDRALAPVHRALGYMLENHDPFPGFVIDRLWNIVLANRAASLMFPGVGTPGKTVNAIRMFFEPGPLFFAAERDSLGTELWMSDGTPAGTVLFKDICPGVCSSSPGVFADIGGSYI